MGQREILESKWEQKKVDVKDHLFNKPHTVPAVRPQLSTSPITTDRMCLISVIQVFSQKWTLNIPT